MPLNPPSGEIPSARTGEEKPKRSFTGLGQTPDFVMLSVVANPETARELVGEPRPPSGSARILRKVAATLVATAVLAPATAGFYAARENHAVGRLNDTYALAGEVSERCGLDPVVVRSSGATTTLDFNTAPDGSISFSFDSSLSLGYEGEVLISQKEAIVRTPTIDSASTGSTERIRMVDIQEGRVRFRDFQSPGGADEHGVTFFRRLRSGDMLSEVDKQLNAAKEGCEPAPLQPALPDLPGLASD